MNTLQLVILASVIGGLYSFVLLLFTSVELAGLGIRWATRKPAPVAVEPYVAEWDR